ncbi:NAD-dependent epimerase [Pseudoalteromonas carrageenovora]|uniref:NAD-dependent epimerase n=1 Tax=Pseudoalteromonas carrageenovora TaxID=227 RepID=UPI002FD30390
MKYLVTGAAGFIGAATCKKLLADGHVVVGIDNLNDYYDVNLKLTRLAQFKNHKDFTFLKLDISERSAMSGLFKAQQFDKVIHLAAQAGVRYSIENPDAYADSNLVGHLNVLEGCRHNKVRHLVYASSSSVYGLNEKTPFETMDSVDHPVSFYAATKKANELMAHSYSHLYRLPTTGLRFFTVYGPWGRPDMAPYIFTKKILAGDTIDINNNGDMWRDFTYIDDIVEGIVLAADIIPKGNPDWSVESGSPATSSAPYTVYNIGHGSPINLMKFIEAIETELDLKAVKNFREMQPGDVYKTYADTQDLFKATGYKAKVGVEQGVSELIKWYKDFYK